MLRKGLLVGMVALVLPAQAAAQGDTREVVVDDDFFSPERVKFDAGTASVHWAWGPPVSQNEHNVRQDDRVFYSGALSATGDFTVTPSAGTFGYYCQLHGFPGGGMAGEIKVKPTGEANGKRANLVWATADTDTGTRFDVRQKVGKKEPEVVEEKTKALDGRFKLKDGKNQFQVRSRERNRVSDWSPKLNLKR
jgi:plastocyanin